MSQHHSSYNMGVVPITYGSVPQTTYSSASSWGTIATNAPPAKITGTPSTISFNGVGSPPWGPGAIPPQQSVYSSSQTAYSPYSASSVLTSASSSTAFAPTAGPVYPSPPPQIRIISCLQNPSQISVNFAHKDLDLSRYGSQMGYSAFEPNITYAKVIIRGANSMKWYLDLHQSGGLRVSDVIRQVHQYLHGHESNSDALSHRMQASVSTGHYRDASHQRDGYAYGTTQRIVLLGAHHFFYGLTPAGENNTWNLYLCTGS